MVHNYMTRSFFSSNPLPPLFLSPACRHRPGFLATITISIFSMFKVYPSWSDTGLFLTLYLTHPTSLGGKCLVESLRLAASSLPIPLTDQAVIICMCSYGKSKVLPPYDNCCFSPPPCHVVSMAISQQWKCQLLLFPDFTLHNHDGNLCR